MKSDSPPKISSFVLRFVQEEPARQSGQVSFRGSIRHVQTDQELTFLNWGDAVAFINRFVPIDAPLSDHMAQISKTGEQAE